MELDIAQICLFFTAFIALMAPILDFKFKKVPTWLTIPSIAIGMGMAAAQGWVSFGEGTISTSLNLSQTLLTLFFVLVLFGPLTFKGGFSKEDLFLIMAVASFNTFTNSMTLIFYIAAFGFLIAIFFLVYKGMLGEGVMAVLRTLSFRKKKRNEDGTLAEVHQLTIPYSPAVALGVITFILFNKEISTL